MHLRDALGAGVHALQEPADAHGAPVLDEQPDLRSFPPPNMTLDEFITEFSMWAIAASPMLVTTPIMNCSTVDTDTKRAIDRDEGEPAVEAAPR